MFGLGRSYLIPSSSSEDEDDDYIQEMKRKKAAEVEKPKLSSTSVSSSFLKTTASSPKTRPAATVSKPKKRRESLAEVKKIDFADDDFDDLLATIASYQNQLTSRSNDLEFIMKEVEGEVESWETANSKLEQLNYKNWSKAYDLENGIEAGSMELSIERMAKKEEKVSDREFAELIEKGRDMTKAMEAMVSEPGKVKKDMSLKKKIDEEVRKDLPSLLKKMKTKKKDDEPLTNGSPKKVKKMKAWPPR